MTININSIEIFLSFLCKIFTISVTKFVWIKILKYDYQITYDFYICICTPKHIYVLHANLSIRTRTCHIRKYMSSHTFVCTYTDKYMHTQVFAHAHVWTGHIHACTHIRIHLYNVYTQIHIYACIHTHIYVVAWKICILNH